MEELTTSMHQKNISFVRTGEQPHMQPKPVAGLFISVSDWELQVDLGKQLKFPDHVTATSLRPDMVLLSAALKQVLLMELTVPWEDHIVEANERKQVKYQELLEQCRRTGWKTRCEPWPTLAGHCARSTHCLASLGQPRGKPSSPPWRQCKGPPDCKRSDLWASAAGTQARV